MHLAHAFIGMKDWKRAERAYLDGIADRPTEAFLYWNLGAWYLARGRSADAEIIFRKGCEVPCTVEGSRGLPSQLGSIATCHQNLASLLAQSGRQNEVSPRQL